jgi:holliday junction DNA helicase RuvA
MIATLTGRLRKTLEDRVIVETGGIGYEVFLPPIALRQVERLTGDGAGADAADGRSEGRSESSGRRSESPVGRVDAPVLSLIIYYHATRDQPRPVLIGFTSELDKEFFERLITVKDIGPMIAARALAAPVAELAAAIARQDEKYLRALPGIGAQKAKNIVAQLQGKVAKFALARDGESEAPAPVERPVPAGDEAVREMVWEVLVKQLGHRPSEASQLIADAFKRRPVMTTAEELFDEIYRGART